jgi:hypothetical protein
MAVDKNNPLGALIWKRAFEQGLDRKEIATRLNYKNPNKGCFRLDQLLKSGWSNPDLLERLQRILAIDSAELADALSQTEVILRQQAEKREGEDRWQGQQTDVEAETVARLSFKPHLWVVPEESVPSPLFLVAIFGEEYFRRISLAETIEAVSPVDQEKLFREAAIRHFTWSKGRAGPFGRITGYLFRRTFDESWRLNTQGKVISRTGGRVHLGGNRLYLNGNPKKDLARLFKSVRHANGHSPAVRSEGRDFTLSEQSSSP